MGESGIFGMAFLYTLAIAAALVALLFAYKGFRTLMGRWSKSADAHMLKRVRMLRDSTKLYNAAANSNDPRVQELAVRRLSDQKYLYALALDKRMISAAHRLDDPRLLKKLVQQSPDLQIRRAAREALEDVESGIHDA